MSAKLASSAVVPNRGVIPSLDHVRAGVDPRPQASGYRPSLRICPVLFLVVSIRNDDIHGGTDDLGADTHSGGADTDCRRADADGRIRHSHYGAAAERRGEKDGHQREDASDHGHRLADRIERWPTTL